MAHPSRNVKSLATLVCCMTGGAFLLAWLEPRVPTYGLSQRYHSYASPQAFRDQARRVVSQLDPHGRREWKAVEVVDWAPAREGEGSAPAPTLAAWSLKNLCDILIETDGLITVVRAMRRERRSQPQPDSVVRIGVAGNLPGWNVPQRQWAALQAVLIELGASPGGDRLRVRIHAAQGRTAQPANSGRDLQVLLAEAGFLG